MDATVVWSTVLRAAAAAAALAGAFAGAAGTLEVSVVDEKGRPIEGVAVYATPSHAAHRDVAAAPSAAATATMDQQGQQFLPHVLVVQAGTEVEFPNGDDVSHHVYSFSDTKAFELPLYKGDVYPPVTFDKPGIVVLGCNIHDGMIGYVVVVDTPHFAVTDEQGVALVDALPSDDYVVQAWTPRARRESLPAAQAVTVASATTALEVRISGRLAPAHSRDVSSLTWDRY